MASARKPRQSRSKATFDAILEAGFLCVGTRGRDATTTQHIADAAGVGIGSLYEYFPNKESIYAAMCQRMADDAVALIVKLSPQVIPLPVEDGLMVLMKNFGEFLLKDDKRYLHAIQELFSMANTGYLDGPGQAIMEALIPYLIAHPEYVDLPDLHAMVYIHVNSVIFVLMRYLGSPHPLISFDKLCQTLTWNVASYFRQSWSERPPTVSILTPAGN